MRFRPKTYDLQQDSKDPRDQEDKFANKVGGKRQPGSGASQYAKGDVDAPDFLYECKQTIHASLSVKMKWLEKISEESLALHKDPALQIEIKGGDARMAERRWVMVPETVFLRLLGGRDEDDD